LKLLALRLHLETIEMIDRVLLIGALLLFFITTVFSTVYITTLRVTIQSNEIALEKVNRQIRELQDHVVYIEEALVRVVITSETNKYRLDLIEEIFD